jgi:LmbE family N-acetylglucosaminyl deacetylase
MGTATPVTGETTWLELLARKAEWGPPCIPTVVISPHPDDETLGAGGLIASQCRKGVPVSIIAVSDGEAAYPEYPDLAGVRRGEHREAARALGVEPMDLLRLRLPDSDISRYEDELAEQIADHLGTGTIVVAPWVRDPHPDHEACGRAAVKAARATGASIVFYLFWAWHRNTPESLFPLPLRKFPLADDLQTRRANALACHRSQLERDNGDPILPECFLAPARRSFETFIVPGSSRR